MDNNIKEDLKLFNELVLDFLEEEIKNPISEKISTKDLREKLNLKLETDPSDPQTYKEAIKKLLLSTPKSSSKLFFNQLFGGRHSKAILGELLAVFLNNSMATYKIAGPQIGVEKEIISQVCQIIGYKKTAGGTLPTGGSMSNFMSLIIARDRLDHKIKKEGINQKLIVYTSENGHYSVLKNVSFSGIGKNNIRKIKSTLNGQICVTSFKNEIEKDIKKGFIPFYLNATAGTTVLYAFDPIKELSLICKRNNIWLHLDGAFGGTVIFSEKYKYLVKGIHLTDSFCFNAHKTLGTPLSTSIFVVQDKKLLYNSFSNEATYLYQTHCDKFNLGHTSFECGRRNNALKLWAMWKAIGTKGLSKIINHQFELANYTYTYVKEHKDYSLYSFKNSLSICFNYKRFDPVDLCTSLYQKNSLMVGFGSFRNNKFIRLVIVNSENSKKDILKFFKTLEEFCNQKNNKIKKLDQV
ncbi:MAG: aminotransferase class V-fold PLP-dependent enzyme [Bacteroidota bacterium]|nr:aminotransferase class V-fold PLP-dependent enzyme [Bacteroidota bacterium]